MEGRLDEGQNGLNFSAGPHSRSIFTSLEIDTDLWDRAKEAKRRFLEKGEDPRGLPYVPAEVAESWLRSRAWGIDPYGATLGHKMNARALEDLVRKKAELIHTTAAYIERFLPLLIESAYLMSLTDENGVVLLQEGVPRDIIPFAEAEQNPFDSSGQSPVGVNIGEASAGTTAHSLCICQRRPIQIIGPYNYCRLLQNNISSATPIFDEENHVIGALAVVQMVAPKDPNPMQSHSLGWVVAMGYAIENLLKVKKRNQRLSVANGILETTLSVVDEGMITVNPLGYISHINREGAEFFAASACDSTNKHYRELMNEDQQLMVEETLLRGKPLQNIETMIESKRGRCPCLMDIKPVYNDEGEESPQGVVIRLVRTEKVNRLVNHRGGATAAYHFEHILGTSPALGKAIDMGRQLGKGGFNILLTGESGTGKELFAQAIHNEHRPDGPFVAINCASMPRNLIESELFGYEGGAFTGAERKGRPGKIELAHGGTLFLDEIGDMPLEIQPVLLRVLEERKVMRVGGTRYIPVDFRVIAATNKDLTQMIQEKSFREDLYYRLSTFNITIPPLRERKDDILLLARHFIADIGEKLHCGLPALSAEASRKIRAYHWPGNVRQLQNAMVYAVNTARSGIIQLSNLPEDITRPLHNRRLAPALPMNEIEKEAILKAIRCTENNKVEAAKLLGLGRTTLYKKMKEYGIKL